MTRNEGIALFLSHIDKKGPKPPKNRWKLKTRCWIWIGTRNGPSGHCRIRIPKTHKKVSHKSWKHI